MGLTKIRAAQISDIDYKQSARVLTDTNITLSGGAPLVVDGITLLDIDRVLVKGQTNGAENGIYRVLIPGTGSDGTWIRSSDANETGEIEAGMIIMVTEGATYGDTQWKLITNDPIIIGVTPLVFEQNSAFAFGNIYANNTAILANVVGDTLVVTPSNNISMVGNATTKTLTLGVVASGSNSDVQFNVNGNLSASNTFQFEPGNTLLVTSANITTTQFYFGDGSQLTNITAAGGSRISSGTSNIAIAATNGVGNVSIDGVQNTVFFTTDGISTSGNYFANTGYFAGEPQLKLWANSNITANIDSNTVMTIDENGVDIRGTLFVNYIESPDSTFVDIRDGLQASELVLSGNIFGTGAVFDGNVTANYFYGNGALLTGIDATSIQNGTSHVRVLSSGGNIQSNVAGNTVMLLTPDGANIYGNVEANYYYGNGSQLTGIEAFSNLVPQSYWLQPNIAGEQPIVANDQGLLFAVAGNGITFDTDPGNHTITINAGLSEVDYDLVTQAVTVSEDLGNITANTTSEYDWGSLSAVAGLLESLGGVIAVGNITTQANVVGAWFTGNVDASSIETESLDVTGNLDANNIAATGVITATGNIVSTGNVSGGNLVTAGRVVATGNIVSTGNVSGGNLVTAGRVVATGNIVSSGNISGTYILGNGSQLTGLPEQYGNSNVAAYLPTYTGNLVSLAGNVTTTANVSAGYFVGNGRVLTGLYDSIAANVLPAANITYDLGSNTNRWNDLWLANSTIHIGEATISATGPNLVLPAVVQIGNTIINGATSDSLEANNIYGNIFTTLIDSSDSSAITITPDVVAQASMEIQNGLTVSGLTNLGATIVNGVLAATDVSATGQITTSANISANNISVTGSVTATDFYGNGQGLTGFTANNVGAIQNGNSNIAVSANGNITMSVAGISNIAVITDVGVGFGNSSPQSRLVVQGLSSNSQVPLFEFYNSTGVLKSNMTSRGAQNWFLQAADDIERGSLRYSTPNGRVGILFLDPDGANRTDIRMKNGGGFTFAATSGGNGTVSPPNVLWMDVNGNVSLGYSPVAVDDTFPDKLTANGTVLITANTSNTALRITQEGAGNALLVEDSTNPDATPFVITQGGNIGIGVYPPLGYFHANVGNLAGDRMILQTDSDGGTSPLCLWNSNTGANVGSGMVFCAGGDGVTTGFFGGISSRKIDSDNSRTLLRVLTGNVLSSLSDGSVLVPFYIEGSNTGPFINMAANRGVGINLGSGNICNAAYNLEVGGAIADNKGDVRSVPPNTQTTAYTLVLGDAGKFISTNAAVTIPNSVFSAGQSVSVYNNSAANITISPGSGVTGYLIGTATTGNRTLAQRGLATVFCVGANTFVIGGGGVT